MTDREALTAAVAARPAEDTPRLAYADWLDEHGRPERAGFVRLQCEADRLRRGDPRRHDLLRRADDLLCDHEPEWLGEWHDRLINWEFRRGFVWKVRLTAATFLAHGDELFRAEPVERVELVDDAGGPLDEDAVREVVSHPAFAFVQDCAVVPGRFFDPTPVNDWLLALAANPHVTRLRAFVPVTGFGGNRLEPAAVEAFCEAPHLATLGSLNLGGCVLADRTPDRLAWRVADAPFAPNLRRLDLGRCSLTRRGLNRIAVDPVFAALRRLNLTGNTEDPAAWRALFRSETLTRVCDLAMTSNHLAEYADSPMPGRVRGLNVSGWDEHTDSGQEVRGAWRTLFASGAPPRRLRLGCHNPGKEVFALMQKHRWLRRVRELEVRGDSQNEVFAGRTAGVRSLFGGNALPRLAKLRLHEVADRRLLAALADWPGLSRLEELALTDDYFGRFVPEFLVVPRPFTGLRRLEGVQIRSENDVDRFLTLPGLDRVRSLRLAVAGEQDRTGRFVLMPGAEGIVRLLRAPVLARLESLSLGFLNFPGLTDITVRQLADPAVMPRLRNLSIWGYAQIQAAVEAIRPRFGLRLTA